jgi:CRP-like cAMP-binding protein
MDFAQHGTELHVAAGRRVLLDGPFPQALVLITAGRGRIRCAGEMIAELGPGDLFGELAPRRQAYDTATVTAVSDLTLIAFSNRQVKLMGQLEPETVADLLGHGHAAFRASAAA